MADLVCERCGNSDPRLFAYRKGKPYCRACLSFSGRQADKTYRIKEGIRLSLSYPLSPRQEACAQKALSLLESGKDVLIHAVTGAGKTELVYPAMARYLEMGLHVGFATPRRDVVIDLLPRIQEAFPMAEVIAVYGGHTQKLEGDIIVLTAHQLYRYEAYFDLLVFDEIDAFPYRGDKMLNRFYHKSIRGKSILLSATPSMSDIHDIESKGGVVLDLFERYHGGKLPLPQVIICHSLLLHKRCLDLLSKLLDQEKPVFVFVPTIAQGRTLFAYLSFFLDGGGFVSSKETGRQQDIALFKAGRLRYLVTTSILERGVTVKALQVIVFDSANPIFDAKALVQIAGRVGRKQDCRDGEVYFLADVFSSEMKEAIDEIRNCNRKAFVPVLPKTV